MEFSRSSTDFSTSTERALDEIDPKWKGYPGVIIFGTHTFENVGEKLELIKKAREQKIPFFGECGGAQLAIIEYARNVLGFADANTMELEPSTKNPVVVKLPSLRVGIRRVGGRYESFWHNYVVNDGYLLALSKDFDITIDSDHLPAIFRLRGHPFFVGTQFHPSYNSSKDDKHPLLVEFLNVCRKL